jgi:hypothetical protein
METLIPSQNLIITEDPEENAKLSANVASATKLILLQDTQRFIVENMDSLTVKQRMELIDQLHKISGEGDKQKAQETAGTGFSITINLPDGTTTKMGNSKPLEGDYVRMPSLPVSDTVEILPDEAWDY